VAVTLNQVNTTLEELQAPIATADAVLKSTDAALLGKDAPLQQDLRNTLQEVTKAARALRILMDYLEQHPDSLLRGKTEDKR
jgi:paraquat-inducible protein B